LLRDRLAFLDLAAPRDLLDLDLLTDGDLLPLDRPLDLDRERDSLGERRDDRYLGELGGLDRLRRLSSSLSLKSFSLADILGIKRIIRKDVYKLENWAGGVGKKKDP